MCLYPERGPSILAHKNPLGQRCLQFFVTVALYHRSLGPVNMRTHKNEFWARKITPRVGHSIRPGGSGSAVVAGKGQVNMFFRYNWRYLAETAVLFACVLFVMCNFREIMEFIF